MNIVETYMNLPELSLTDIQDYIRTKFVDNGLCDDIICTIYEPSFNDGDSCIPSVQYFHVKIGDEFVFVGNGKHRETDPEEFEGGVIIEVSEQVRDFVTFLATATVAEALLLHGLCFDQDEFYSVSITTGEHVGNFNEDY